MNIYSFRGSTNYQKTQYELNGCNFDLEECANKIDNHFHIPFVNRVSLMEQSLSWKNILEKAKIFPRIVKSGDILFVSYSGHGTQVNDLDGDEKKDGKDEALVTADFKFITDDQIYLWLSQFVPGCLVIGFFDCCHSGTLDRSFEQKQNVHYVSKDIKCNTVLYSGCKDPQTSADAFIDKRHRGAFTFSILTPLEREKYQISYIKLLEETNRILLEKRFSQIAQMTCSKGIENKIFGTM